MDKNLSKAGKILESEYIALDAIFFLWTRFCFLEVNLQKHVVMVSTNNVQNKLPWPDLQMFLIETIPHYVFD